LQEGAPAARSKLDAIGLAVADLSASVAFYRRLGVDFGDPVDPEGHGHAEADLGGGFRLLLDTIEGIQAFDPKFRPAAGDPRASLAFRCSSPPAVDELYAELVKSGGIAHQEPWDAFWGQRYAQLRDPDGNGVDLYANL
jgi:catechol 2,3-dioxygenase-like lactoylglutathione lyase family enzyme